VKFSAVEERARELQHNKSAKDYGKLTDTNIYEVKLTENMMCLTHLPFGRDLEDLQSILDTEELMGHRSGL